MTALIVAIGDFFTRLAGWRRWLTALAAGAVASLALPPLGAWPAMLAAFPVLVWLLDGVAAASGRWRRVVAAAALGWTFAFGYFAASLWWLGNAFFVEAEKFAWLMPLAVTAMPAGLALFWALALALAALAWRPGGSRIWLLAATLGVGEWLRGHLFTGFPWNAPGYAAAAIPPLESAASLVGLYGLTFIVIAAAAAPAVLADAASAVAARLGALLAGLGLAAAVAGVALLAPAAGNDTPGKVLLVVVQPNIAQKEKWKKGNAAAIFARYMSLTAQALAKARLKPAASRIVVWPESALPFLIEDSAGARSRIAAMLDKGEVLVTGALTRKPGQTGGARQPAYFNALLVFDDTARIIARYHKWRLVPFGEYLPLAGLLRPLGIDRLVAVPGGFTGGPGPRTIAVAGLPPFAAAICYEAIFPGRLIAPGARPAWIVQVTNDAWFGDSAGPYQHFAQARMRAIEEGLPLVRAANTGISAIVTAAGAVTASLGLDSRGALTAYLPPPAPATIYVRFGDWPFALAVIVTLALAGWKTVNRAVRLTL